LFLRKILRSALDGLFYEKVSDTHS
jgi:hypothetical protein